MKWLILLASASLVACSTQPDLPAGPPLGEEQARHLLVRTGFNAKPDEIRQFAQLSAARASNQLLKTTRNKPTQSPPDWVDSWDRQPKRELTAEERMAQNRLFRERGQALRAWWYQEMLTTRSPLTERMTLFWHNHFTSSLDKVRVPQLIYQQHALLRRHALGNFGDLLHAISRDPAMLIYLDGARNVVGSPNENYAREVMELFTLGEGHYTEQDIREAARALTGWGVDMDFGEFVARAHLHDQGKKTIFGKTGHFDGDDLIDLILTRPETSEFIVIKLWKEFISPFPDAGEVTRLAKLFRDGHYEIKPLLQALFTSPAFYAAENRGQLVRSPVELIAGTLRNFDLAPRDWQPFINAARQMGQDILNPPNVKGWPGGEWWINSQTLTVRQQFANRLLRGDGRGARGQLEPDYMAWLARCDAVCSVRTLLPQAPPTLPQGNPPQIVRQIVADPRYQLK